VVLTGPVLAARALTVAAAPLPRARDIVLAPGEQAEPSLPLASEGVQRWVWHSRYGAMLIEVTGGEIFVNGERVEPHPNGERVEPHLNGERVEPHLNGERVEPHLNGERVEPHLNGERVEPHAP
jgi:hypothetical protein